MNKITCDMCMDLIPLVQDGVASRDSEEAVLEHIKECPSCSECYNGLEQKPEINDIRIVSKIRKRISITALIMIGLSVLFGIGLTASKDMFYNIIIMPVIGAVGFVILKNKSYWVSGFVFLIALMWNFIMFAVTETEDAFLSAMTFAFIYTGLCALGTLVAFLLYFAFKKEEK